MKRNAFGIRLGVTLVLALASEVTGATHAQEPGMTTSDLVLTSKAAAEYVQQEVGVAAFDAIYGISVKKTKDGDAAQAAIYYREGTAAKSVNLFCHHHAGAFDCHQL